MRELSPQSRKMLQTQVVSGWKEIAAYLGKGVRTVQRYERILGLPIRRPGGKMRGAVLATNLQETLQLSLSPRRTIDTKKSLGELRKQLEELHRLRVETTELGRTVAHSLELLRTNLEASVTETVPGFSPPAFSQESPVS